MWFEISYLELFHAPSYATLLPVYSNLSAVVLSFGDEQK
jgi:hypothetical protein